MTAPPLAVLAEAAAVGLVATAVIDLWAALLRRAFAVSSLDPCLLGRWVLHMKEGRFAHRAIARAAARRHECATGWAAHYGIGAGFGVLFVLLASARWLERPALVPAVLFGVVTVVVPFSTMQPAFGLGFAASKTPQPARARLKSLMTHTVFGVGLYLGALAASAVVR